MFTIDVWPGSLCFAYLHPVTPGLLCSVCLESCDPGHGTHCGFCGGRVHRLCRLADTIHVKNKGWLWLCNSCAVGD